MRWLTIIPVLNEEKFIASRIYEALSVGDVIVAEASFGIVRKGNEQGLSTDRTTEIIESFGDKITHMKIGHVERKGHCVSQALKLTREINPDIIYISDADEFMSEGGYKIIEKELDVNDSWFVAINMYEMLDQTISYRLYGPGPPYWTTNNHFTMAGEFRERVLRYRPDIKCDLSGQMFFNGMNDSFALSPNYRSNRHISKAKIMHYRNVRGYKAILEWETKNFASNNKIGFDRAFEIKKEEYVKVFRDTPVAIKMQEHSEYVLNSGWFKELEGNRLEDILKLEMGDLNLYD